MRKKGEEETPKKSVRTSVTFRTGRVGRFEYKSEQRSRMGGKNGKRPRKEGLPLELLLSLAGVLSCASFDSLRSLPR